jgi:drug/metabolite transporter (DMT)-like permease
MVAQKTRVFTALVIVTNVVGNLLLSMGMRQVGSMLGRPPVAYIQALFHPLVAAGVALLIVWMISQMTLLSWADLSYVMPITSLGYVLAALAGRVFLNEQVTWQRWGGIGLIMFGVLLVSRTKPLTETRASSACP